jgi:hypothetical protein
MSLTRALKTLDSAIPDDLVEAKLREVLKNASGDDAMVRLELGEAEGDYVSVPVDARLEIVTKAFFKEYLGTTIGDFRVQVAVGGVCASSDNVLTARLCFATLFFNAHGQCFSTDFHLKVR